jgi:NAD(P)-dependent dehydrogenase (short-subunit alcohol dehydrogenase family)
MAGDRGEARVALVQGASRGLGLAFAEELLRRPDVDRVVATSRNPEASEGLARLRADHGDALVAVALNVRDESSIAAAAERVAAECGPRLHWLINCAGVLHGEDAVGPEKKLEDADPARLRAVFEVNAFGPLLVAKHFFALLRHEERAVLANLSARVGSLGDNHLGGWYAYRASKAAQNMFTRNLAIELGRRAPNVICLALHPGTVDTDLSRPFQRNVPPESLFEPGRAAAQLLGVMDARGREDSGGFFAWDGQPIPW